jgi:intracellular multiplication protein IcmN
LRRLHVGFSGPATWVAALMVLLVLTGCHKRQFAPEQEKLPYKVAGTSDRTMVATLERFNREGVRVITIGQNYMISIPSALLFPDESPQLTWRSYALLNAVTCYLKQFREISINVTAFSNKCVSAQRDHALTLARARAVGNYIWSQGIDSRFIFTQGLGSDKPIVSFTQKGDQSPNSRIEITFRDAVA